jgi:single-strand DNA-binding protein
LFLVPSLVKEQTSLQQKGTKQMKKAKTQEEPKAAAPAYQNQVRLVGFLGGDPEQHEDRTVFSLATKTSWKAAGSDEWQSHTEWHRVVAWGKLAPPVGALAKGDHVLVDGELRSSQYERDVPVVGVGMATVTVKAWEIRARAVRKLVHKANKKAAAA